MKKKWLSVAFVSCLLLQLFAGSLTTSAASIDTSGLPEPVMLEIDPSAAHAQVYQDGTRLIANDLVCGNEVFQVAARFEAVDPPEDTPLYTTICLGFAYQNGDGAFGSNPNFSFYQFRTEFKGTENNAFIQLHKQVNDTDCGRIKPVTVDGEGQDAAADGFYVTADNGWNTNAEKGFILTATVDLKNNQAVCQIEGITTGTKGTMTVDLSAKAMGEKGSVSTLGAGGVFVDFDSEWVTLKELKVAGKEVAVDPVPRPTGSEEPNPTGGNAGPANPGTGEPAAAALPMMMLAAVALSCMGAVYCRRKTQKG